MRFTLLVLSLALALFPIGHLSAQDQPGGVAPQQQMLDAGQLDQLVAPIALHPDPGNDRHRRSLAEASHQCGDLSGPPIFNG